MSDTTIVGELFADLENGSPALWSANDLALQLQDQNARYAEATEVFKDDPEVLELARLDIAEEQTQTWTRMLELAPESGRVFEGLGFFSIAAPKALSAVEIQQEAAQADIETARVQSEIAGEIIEQAAAAWEFPLALLDQYCVTATHTDEAPVVAEDLWGDEQLNTPLFSEETPRKETHGQRKERMKQELEGAITGPTRRIIKAIQISGALEKGGIHFDRLNKVFDGIKILADDARDIVGGEFPITDDCWLKNTEAVRLVLAASSRLANPVIHDSVTSRQWRSVVNEKVTELINKELRGIERRNQAIRSKAL